MTCQLVSVWNLFIYDAKSLSDNSTLKKMVYTNLLEILCFQWNRDYGIIETDTEVFWGIYFIKHSI